MKFGNVQPLQKENVLGQPPRPGMLRKKIFGKPVTPSAAPPEQPFKGQSLNPFGKQPTAPKAGGSLFKRLTGK